MQFIGSSVVEQIEYQFDNFVLYTGSDPYYSNGSVCVPDWTCGGYESCPQNGLQSCTAAVDNNSCGDIYLGNYSEFSPQACVPCAVDWLCAGYGNCLITNLSNCNSAADNASCGYTYGGNYSEFSPQACVYCASDWVCDGYGICSNSNRTCNSAFDNNGCGNTYAGNYSEFPSQACVVPPITGYANQYTTGDFAEMFIDFFGNALVMAISLVGIFVLIVLGANAMIKGKKIVGGK